jgi:hypothetical protein
LGGLLEEDLYRAITLQDLVVIEPIAVSPLE